MSKEVWTGDGAEGQQQQALPPAYAPNYHPQAQPYQGGAQTMAGANYAAQPTYAAQPQQQYYAPSPYSQPSAPVGAPVYYASAPPQPILMQQRGPMRVQGGAACAKCGTTYPLPNGASSWRCKNCSEFNNLGGDQCVIL